LQTYSKVIKKTQQIKIATNLLLSKINHCPNNLYITYGSKGSQLASKIIQKNNIYKGTLLYQSQAAARMHSMIATATNRKQFSIVDGNYNYQV